MVITPDNKLKKLIVIGDRVLIKPLQPNERTASGLYLPPGVQEKEKVQQGYVLKTGPGYAIPLPVESEPWKDEEEQIKYVPLQAKEGDLAIFERSGEGIRVTARSDAKLLVMDGKPINEPMVGHGPFVMNSRAEIQQAFEDYQLGRMGELPN